MRNRINLESVWLTGVRKGVEREEDEEYINHSGVSCLQRTVNEAFMERLIVTESIINHSFQWREYVQRMSHGLSKTNWSLRERGRPQLTSS